MGWCQEPDHVRSVSLVTIVLLRCFLMLFKGIFRIIVMLDRLWEAVMAKGVFIFGVRP